MPSRYAKRPVPAGGARGPQNHPATPASAANPRPSAVGAHQASSSRKTSPAQPQTKPSAAAKQEPPASPMASRQSSPPAVQPTRAAGTARREPRPPASPELGRRNRPTGPVSPALGGRAPDLSRPGGTVLATTVRLWTGAASGRIAAVVARAGALAGAARGRALVARGLRGRRGHGACCPRVYGRAAVCATASRDPRVAAAAAARQQAAAWVASQAQPPTPSWPATPPCARPRRRTACSAYRTAGAGPRRGADPLGSDLVVATPAVRGQFGARLAGRVRAPVTLAAFGSGAARIDVRAMAP